MSRVFTLSGTLNEKDPSVFVVVPVLVPLATTETPARPPPSLLSEIFPETVFCAKRDCVRPKSSTDKPILRSSCFTSIIVSFSLDCLNLGNMYNSHKKNFKRMFHEGSAKVFYN